MGWPVDGQRGEKSQEEVLKEQLLPLQLRVPAGRRTIAAVVRRPTICADRSVDEAS